MLLELLKGIATNQNSSVTSILPKVCGRWQTQKKFLNPTQNSVDVVGVVSFDADSRVRSSTPCDIKALTNMFPSKINLDIPFNK